jgi:hypothetical protein
MLVSKPARADFQISVLELEREKSQKAIKQFSKDLKFG